MDNSNTALPDGPRCHPSGAEPVPVSGIAGIANAITPGKWAVEKWSAKEGQVVARHMGGRSLICAGVLTADAHLIAAAPNMLAALKQYATGYTDTGALARAVIAAAEAKGENQ